MTDTISTPTNTTGVSGFRKAVSICLLLIALVVLAIELRAGIGQSNSAKALAGVSTKGLFKNLAMTNAQEMLSLSPVATVIRDNKDEKVFHYRWVSFLRPLIGQPQPELFLVSSATEPAYAIAFYTDPEDAKSGFYGDALPAEEPTGYVLPTEDDPLNLPDAPMADPAAETWPETAAPTEESVPATENGDAKE